MVEPTERERNLARWLVGNDEAKETRVALALAYYREELLAPFVSMHEDYCALKDRKVAEHLKTAIDTTRGVP